MAVARLLNRTLKRSFDVVAAAVGLVTLALPMAALAIAIKVDSPGPVLYRGERIGLRGRPFGILKFRNMYQWASGGPTCISEDDERITRLGRFMRRYKLDELPQLFNVLVGDMSMVGPRPEVRRFVEMYGDKEKAILSIRPGITDWASIRFRNQSELIRASGYSDPDEAYLALVRPEKLRLQLEYVRSQSFATDLRIIWTTFFALVRPRRSARSRTLDFSEPRASTQQT